MRRVTWIILLAAAWCAWGRAATLVTRDGRTLEGAVRFDEVRVVIRQENGEELGFEVSAIKRLTIAPVTTPAARQEEIAKPRVQAAALEGLRADYFDKTFTDRRLSRIEPRINLELADDQSPDPSVEKDFAVRFTGLLSPEHSGRHTFAVQTHGDGEPARLWINDQLVINRWNGEGEFVGAIDLWANREHQVKLEYVNADGPARVRLLYTSLKQGMHIVPASRFSPPKDARAPRVELNWPPDSASVYETPIVMSATTSDAAQVEFFRDGVSLGVVRAAPYEIPFRPATAGNYRVFARATGKTGLSADTPMARVTFSPAKPTSIPKGWAEIGVNKLPATGLGRFADGAFTLEDLQSDLMGEKDAFAFVFQPLSGDGSIVARLAKYEHADAAGAAAGIAIRENLLPGAARLAFAGISPDTGLLFVRRDDPLDQPQTVADAGAAPHWLKLTRHGKEVRAYASEDGKSWRNLASKRMEMSEHAYVGLAIATPGQSLGRASFDNVKVICGPPAMESTVTGVMLVSGSIIAGEVVSMDKVSLKLKRAEGMLTIPGSKVARVLFRPLETEAVQQLAPGASGVLLANGDFLEGTIESIEHAELRLNSLLFGLKKFFTWDQVVAGMARPVDKGKHEYVVRVSDGSVIHADEVRVEKEKLVVTEGVRVEIRGDKVVEVTRGD